MERSKRKFATLGGAKMKRYFRCGECGADFDHPIIRFDNGLKVCPACLSLITDDALSLFSIRQKYLQRQILTNNGMIRLFDKLFPVDTKTIFEDE